MHMYWYWNIFSAYVFRYLGPLRVPNPLIDIDDCNKLSDDIVSNILRVWQEWELNKMRNDDPALQLHYYYYYFSDHQSH